METKGRYPSRTSRTEYNYAKLNTGGKTPAKALSMTQNGDQLTIGELSDDRVSDNTGQTLVDKPILGDLTEDNCWSELKSTHEQECENILKKKLLAERQLYLMRKRKEWVDNDRQIKLMELEAIKIDKNEIQEASRFQEKMTYHKAKYNKVEDWFKTKTNRK